MSKIMAGAEAPGEDGQNSKKQTVSGSPSEMADAAQFEAQIGRLLVSASGTLAWRITVGGRCLALSEQCTAKQYADTIATICGRHPARTLRHYRAEACHYAQIISNRRLNRQQIQADAKLLKKLELEIVAEQLADRRLYSSRDLRTAVGQLPTEPASALVEPPPSPAAKSQRARTMAERLLERYLALPEGVAKAKCRERLRQLHGELSQPNSETKLENAPPAGVPEVGDNHNHQNEQPTPTEE